MPNQLTHFWIGRFDNQPLFDNFFEETYSEDEDVFISKFAESQNETWIDYDFLEIGFENNDKPIKDKFVNYSYAKHWIDELGQRIEHFKTPNINTIVMCNLDGNRSEIEFPNSFKGEGYYIRYIGKIEFEFEDPSWFKEIFENKND